MNLNYIFVKIMSNCLFCKIINKEIPSHLLYENEKTIAILDAFPVEKGHTLIISKECQSNLLTISEESAVDVAKTQRKITKLLNEKLNPAGFNFVNNFNSIAGQKINHYHVHIIPKYEADVGFISCPKLPAKPLKIAEIWKEVME